MASWPLRKLAHVVLIAGGAFVAAAQEDVLTMTNGERFVGTVIKETEVSIQFESKMAGQITVQRARVSKLERMADPLAVPEPPAFANTQTNATAWWPPTLPADDKFDWIQLKSGEWLKGKLRGIERQQLEFDSDELDDLKFDWEDIRRVRTHRSIDARLNDGKVVSGAMMATPAEITILGEEPMTIPRDELVSLSPSGKSEWDLWSGKVSIGLTFRSGNTREVDYNAQAELRRRTAGTRLSLDYLGSFSKVNDVQTENNQRANGEFDVWLTRRLFLVAPMLQYFSDPLQNIAHQGTAGVGLGYDIFQRPGLEWNVTAGPAYQYTWFETTQPGEDSSKGAAALVFGTNLDWELTRKIDFIFQYQGIFTDREAGQTTHHALVKLETEVTKLLDFDVSFVWDRVTNTAGSPTGAPPSPDDFRLIFSLGLDF